MNLKNHWPPCKLLYSCIFLSELNNDCLFLCHMHILEWMCTLMWHDKKIQSNAPYRWVLATLLNHLRPVWLNSWVFLYKLSGCGFGSSCSHLNWIIFLIFAFSFPLGLISHSSWTCILDYSVLRPKETNQMFSFMLLWVLITGLTLGFNILLLNFINIFKVRSDSMFWTVYSWWY